MSVTSDDLRQTAMKQLQERRDFVPHLLAYVLVNAGLIVVWALSLAYASPGRPSSSSSGAWVW